jgi:uncharacterized protein (TIGR03437 family)
MLFSVPGAAQAPPNPLVHAVVNAASWYPSALSPGAPAVVSGAELSGGSFLCAAAADGQWPVECGGVSVTLGGRPAALSYVVPNQIGIQIPVDSTPGATTLVVERKAGGATLRSAPFSLTLYSHSPGLFTISGASSGVVLGVFADGSLISSASPVGPGETAGIYAVGLGPTNPAVATGALSPATPVAVTVSAPKVTVGGRDCEVLGAGLVPQMHAVYQVVFRAPADTPRGELPILVEMGGRKSQPGVILPVATMAIGAVANTASGDPGMVSGSLVSIYGKNLAPTTRDWTGAISGNQLPTELDGVTVKINGKAAALSYISPRQINVQAPTDSRLGPVMVEVKNSLGAVTTYALLKAFSPGLFLFAPEKLRYVVALHADGSYVAKAGLFPDSVAARPGRPGDVILLYCTGFGPTTPAVPSGEVFSGTAPLSDPSKLTIRIGDAAAEVQFAGLTGVGLYQFNVVVPDLPDGDHAVLAEIGGEKSQASKFITVMR